MTSSMPGLANYAQKYSEKHPGKAVQFFFMPQSINQIFQYVNTYDFAFGEHFYDYSWHAGISHEKLMTNIHVPTVFIQAKDRYSPDGILMAASSDEQARRAVNLIRNCRPVELESSHLIHWYHPDVFLDAINSLSHSDLTDCNLSYGLSITLNRWPQWSSKYKDCTFPVLERITQRNIRLNKETLSIR